MFITLDRHVAFSPRTDQQYKIYVRRCWQTTESCYPASGVSGLKIEKVFEVQRVSDRIIPLKMIVGQCVITFLSVYAPQCFLSDADKDLLYIQRCAVTGKIPVSEFLTPCGDLHGHVGSTGSGFREVHGGFRYGRPEPDTEGERILEDALAYDLLLGNTCFKK